MKKKTETTAGPLTGQATMPAEVIEAGDLVRTKTFSPDAAFLEFEVICIREFHASTMAESEKYGWIAVDLLTLVKKGAENA